MNPAPATQNLNNRSIAVTSTGNNRILQEKASKLADTLQINHIPQTEQGKYNLLLVYTEKGLQIQLKENRNKKIPATLMVDFLSDSLSYRRQHGGGIKQALAKAVGIKPGIRPSILDATAGLGKDSFLLASLGCKVCMIERSPLLAALLNDGLERAAMSEELEPNIINKLSLVQGDAATIVDEYKNTQQEKPDTIYLDPMYPH